LSPFGAFAAAATTPGVPLPAVEPAFELSDDPDAVDDEAVPAIGLEDALADEAVLAVGLEDALEDEAVLAVGLADVLAGEGALAVESADAFAAIGEDEADGAGDEGDDAGAVGAAEKGADATDATDSGGPARFVTGVEGLRARRGGSDSRAIAALRCGASPRLAWSASLRAGCAPVPPASDVFFDVPAGGGSLAVLRTAWALSNAT
jgi:hypothetical protein